MLFTTLLLAGTASASCLHGVYKRAEAEAEGPFQSTFGYEGTFGPANWAGLAPENSACSLGSKQSPINLDSAVTLATEKPVLDIPEQNSKFLNLNTTIEVEVNGTTTFGGNQFRLAQYHIHTPSEHRIAGEYHPLEVHMVHTGVADESQIVVLALLFEMSVNTSDPVIAGITPHLSAITTPGAETEIEGGIDFAGVVAKVAESNIMQYTGSLTTPPCSEGVTFLIVESPLSINVADYNAIKKIVKFNSRLTQNVLDSDNILAVGSRSIEMAKAAVAAGANSTAEEAAPAEGEAPAASAEAAGPASGSTITVSELLGTPLATPLLGVVPKA
ncbi:carbonic anhydrase [Lentithecium fluviatile CBS 122367]|uniref:Carbonic anhydrase n=1 Tax=Lentithecium fluviatile CBS 122367 TaxID=1168545 RepID=A0A6G1JMH0_9PLEO|nr:carbonic anhydrase [Lentithecium fluviatile CBS 122367]